MKKYFIYIASAMCSVSVAQNRTINFEHGTFSEIKAKALKENKLIFIDAYTTWCGPCKYMAKNIFTNDTVADYYNKHFVNAKIDMEKGEGIQIAEKYEVKCYPNLLFVDGNGNLVHRVAGSMSVRDFIALAEDAQNPEKCYLHFEKNYGNNRSNADFLKQYIFAKEGTCLEPGSLVDEYFSLLEDEVLFHEENWNMIQSFVNSIDSKTFSFLMSNKDRYVGIYSQKVVDDKIADVFKNSLQTVLNTKPFNESKYADVKAKILGFNSSLAEQVFFEVDLNRAAQNSKWDDYSKLAIANVDKYYMKDASALNNICWTFYENMNDKEVLGKAEIWAKKACELEPSYANLDTYAAVLYKIGRKQLATETANKAIERAKKEKLKPEDYQGTTDLLKKINELK